MRATFAANQECLANAMSAEREHRLAFFDAMPWAAAREAGRQLLIPEDFEGGQGIEGVTFVDPFLERNATLLSVALPPA